MSNARFTCEGRAKRQESPGGWILHTSELRGWIIRYMRTIFKGLVMAGVAAVIGWQPGQAQQSFDLLIRGGGVVDARARPLGTPTWA